MLAEREKRAVKSSGKNRPMKTQGAQINGAGKPTEKKGWSRENPKNQGCIEIRENQARSSQKIHQNQERYQQPEECGQNFETAVYPAPTVLEEELNRIDPEHIKDLALIGLDMLKGGRTPGTLPINNQLIEQLKGI